MDNVQTLDYITISRKEYIEFIDKKLNYEHLLNAIFSRSKFSFLTGGLQLDEMSINHVLCALETERFYETLYRKETEYKEEMERLNNAYGNNQSDK